MLPLRAPQGLVTVGQQGLGEAATSREMSSNTGTEPPCRYLALHAAPRPTKREEVGGVIYSYSVHSWIEQRVAKRGGLLVLAGANG